MLGPVIQRKSAALFRLFDADGDGFWERSDFEQFVERLAGSQGLEPGSAKREVLSQAWVGLWEAISQADSDGDGRVTFDEVLAFQEHAFTPETVSGFAGILFPTLDADDDGAIGLEEYRQLLALSSIDPAVADGIFPRLDTNGDGRITADEFDQLNQEYFLSDDPDAPGSSFWGPF